MATMKSSSNNNNASLGAKKLIFSHLKYEHLLAGISGGVTSTLLLHPLDLIKIRFAVNDGRTAAVPQYRGLTSAFSTIFRQEGVKGLYKGVTPNVWGSGSAWGLYFMFYNSIKTWVQEGNSTLALGPAMHMLVASEAGICTLILTNPIWVVKTRLCLQLNNVTIPDNRNYKGMIDGLTKIYKTEGVRGLYRGFVPGLFGVSHGAVQFMVYEEMKNHYNEYRKLPIDTKMLPFGFMMQCLKAYSSPSLKIIHENKRKVELANNIKYAGRDSTTTNNNDDTPENAAILNLHEDDEFVQEIKRKFATSDIVVHEHDEKFNEENVIAEEGKEMCEETLNLRRKLAQIRTSLTSKMNKTPTKSRPKKILQDLDSFMEKSASEEFTFEVPNDPNLSPYHTSLKDLAEMPPICVVSTNLDPCLDDCIMYAKKLRAANNDLTLDILSGLPHGFLNFLLISKEAHEGNKLCMKRIKELIDKK